MPAEHCTPAVHFVVQHSDDVVGKQYNKSVASLKRRTCDGSFYNARHSAIAPHKRRRLELKNEGSERVGNVVRRSHKGQANNRHLTRILGLRKPTQPNPTTEIQDQIQALQHILSLVELPITPPASPTCSQASQWTVKLNDAEKEGSCEVLASASFNVREDLLGVPINTLPTELTLRETLHKCVWRHLKTDLNVTEVQVEFLGSDAGKLFRHMLWKTRKSAVFSLPNNFEFHLVPVSANTGDEELMTGYICPINHAHHLAEHHTPTPLPLLLQSPLSPSAPLPKTLAAALDIDDTLVRLIPAADKDKYPASRIHTLPMFGDKPEWVLALSTHVEHFLSQISHHYHLALYSVGVPEYVLQVAQVLDPNHTLFDWGLLEEGLSSARHEHDHGDTSPKHFAKLFSFVNRPDGVEDWSRCVGVDDSCGAWSPVCRDRIVDPQPSFIDGVWDSNLLQATERLEEIYNKFHADDCNNLCPQ